MSFPCHGLCYWKPRARERTKTANYGHSNMSGNQVCSWEGKGKVPVERRPRPVSGEQWGRQTHPRDGRDQDRAGQHPLVHVLRSQCLFSGQNQWQLSCHPASTTSFSLLLTRENKSVLVRSLLTSNLTLETSCWHFLVVSVSSHQIGTLLGEYAYLNTNSVLLWSSYCVLRPKAQTIVYLPKIAQLVQWYN